MAPAAAASTAPPASAMISARAAQPRQPARSLWAASRSARDHTPPGHRSWRPTLEQARAGPLGRWPGGPGVVAPPRPGVVRPLAPPSLIWENLDRGDGTCASTFPRGRQRDRPRGSPRAHRAQPDLGWSGSPPTTTRWYRGCAASRAAGAGHRHPDAAVVPARGHRRGQGGAQAASRAPAWSCCPSTTTPSTRSRCSPRARPATPTSSRTASPRATSWPTPIRAVATGGTVLDPAIVEALVRPVADAGGLRAEEELLSMIAEGKPIKAIAAARQVPPAAVDAEVERCSSSWPRACARATRRAEPAPAAPPGDRRPRGAGRDAVPAAARPGSPRSCATRGRRIGETEQLVVTVLMSDIRAYSTIAEHADPAQLAGQLNTHRAAMNRAILGEGGTVMQFVGDAVMAVFGAPFPQADHADRAVAAAAGMHALQAEINARWRADGPAGVRPGHRAVDRRGRRGAARLGGAARVHARRRHGQPGPAAAAARRGRRDGALRGHHASALTVRRRPSALPAQLVKGRDTPVVAYKLARRRPGGGGPP